MLQFTINKNLDSDGESLRRLLKAHVVYERMVTAKRLSLYLLAIVSAGLWVGVMWPALLPAWLLDSALALWGGLLFLVVLATVQERLWQRKVARYRDEHQEKQKEDAGPTG